MPINNCISMVQGEGQQLGFRRLVPVSELPVNHRVVLSKCQSLSGALLSPL